MSRGKGWAVVAAAFTSAALVYGITYSFGVVSDAMVAEFDARRGATAVVFSFTVALLSLLGLVTGPLADRHGPRPLVLAGTGVLVAGLLLTAVAGSIWIAYVTYGVGVGVAGSCFFVPLVAAVGGWFEQRRATALGIAVTGIGAGTLVMPPIVARLVEARGLRGTCLILAIAAAVVLPLGAHRPPHRSHGEAALLVSLIGGTSVCGRVSLAMIGARWDPPQPVSEVRRRRRPQPGRPLVVRRSRPRGCRSRLRWRCDALKQNRPVACL